MDTDVLDKPSQITEIIRPKKNKKIQVKESEQTKPHSRLANFGNKRVTWQKGVSPNPGGRPKRDMAAEIARALFERDPHGLLKAFDTAMRKGNSGVARMFSVFSDRAYGKLTEHLQVDANVSLGVVERLQAARLRLAKQGGGATLPENKPAPTQVPPTSSKE